MVEGTIGAIVGKSLLCEPILWLSSYSGGYSGWWLMVGPSLSISLGSSLSVCSSSWRKNLCRGSPWFHVYLGSPTALTNWHTPLLSRTVSLSLRVDLGLIPLKLLCLDPSPSVDAKEVPRLNGFLALTPSGGLATPTRETTHREVLAGHWNTPRLQHTSTKRGSYLTSTRTQFRPFSCLKQPGLKLHRGRGSARLTWEGPKWQGVPLHRRA